MVWCWSIGFTRVLVLVGRQVLRYFLSIGLEDFGPLRRKHTEFYEIQIPNFKIILCPSCPSFIQSDTDNVFRKWNNNPHTIIISKSQASSSITKCIIAPFTSSQHTILPATCCYGTSIGGFINIEFNFNYGTNNRQQLVLDLLSMLFKIQHVVEASLLAFM